MTDRGKSNVVIARKGLFISFEGTEGSGKTTQVGILVDRLKQHGYDVARNQEPGGTPIGRQIRRALLDPENREMTAMTELLLVFASRAQAAAELIKPALDRGAVVVSDRFTDSSLAYQGAAGGLGFDTVMAAHKLALASLFPDLTIWIDVDVEQGLERANGRNAQRSVEESNEARIDRQPTTFHKKVRDGYVLIAAKEPRRFRVIDGNPDVATVAERVWREVEPVLPAIELSKVTQ